MNRQERRKAERKVSKEMDVLKKLPESEVIKINNIIEKVSKQRNDEMLNAVDVSLTALLLDKGYKFREVSILQDELAELLNEDIEKTRLLAKENVDMIKIEKEVKEFLVMEIEKRRAEGIEELVIKKEVIAEGTFKFPKLSKSKMTNDYGRVIEEMELEDAAKYILEDSKGNKKGENEIPTKFKEKKKTKKEEKQREKKEEEIVEEVAKDLQKKIEKEEKKLLDKEEEKVSRFKINKQEVIKKVEFEGDNGTYQGQTGIGIALEANGVKLAFTNIESLDSFYEEFRQAFELI